MNREPVNSSSIRSIGYEVSEAQLEVEFNSGDIYLYHNVPQRVFSQLMAADSLGSAFHFLIREAGYSYIKL